MNMTIKKNAKGNIIGSQRKATSMSKVRANKDYQEASEYIQCAISALSRSARKSDVLASESIANLSVILFDLK